MAICAGWAPRQPAGRSMHGLAKGQRCGALPELDGYCVVHLKERGYTRCPTCGAWCQPRGHRGLAVPICDACTPPARWPTSQELDSRAHMGDGDGAAREAGAWRTAPADPPPATAPPGCPECESRRTVLVADAAYGEAPRDVYRCEDCGRVFQPMPF